MVLGANEHLIQVIKRASMRTEREQDRPSESASKAETKREKIAEQLSELEAAERVLARYSKGPRARKTAAASTPAAVTKAATGKPTPAGRTRRTPRAPGTQNEILRPNLIMELALKLAGAIPPGLALSEPSEYISYLKSMGVLSVGEVEGHAGLGESAMTFAEEDEVAADVDAILKRLDQGIAAEHAAMDRLLARIVSRASQ
jgi:hypothetical protein